MLQRRRAFLVVSSVLAIGVALGSGCAESSLDVGARGQPDSGAPPSFTPDPDGGDVSQPNVPRLFCAGTECPHPYATCAAGESGQPAVYKCQHNLLVDNDNCGACGNVCPLYETLRMKSSCINGACEAECIDQSFKNCNGRLEDGCETSVADDANNCGACGKQCPPGVKCRLGACGCPAGLIECNDQCIDPTSNKFHCGACGNACATPDGATPPPHSEYTCVGGECGKLRCIDEHTSRWLDCDNDLDKPGSNGCEVDVGTEAKDPNNCGGCGITCAPGQLCREVDGVMQCICKVSETMCGTPDFPQCADLASDPTHCGACGYTCPMKELTHQNVSCRKGLCAYECAAGWGDCNENPLDGCETNLMVHGANCGACGTRCDSAAGQPCIQGVCLQVDCDAGGPR